MKKVLILTVAFVFALTPAFGQAALKAKAAMEAKLKDFSIKYANDQGQEQYYMTQIVTDAGSYFELIGEGHNSMKGPLNKHEIRFADFAANKIYDIDVAEKEYEVMSMDSLRPAQKDSLRQIDFMLGSNLFIHASDMNEDGYKKIGSEKVNGRDATVYAIELSNGVKQTYWVDNEYNFTLKYVQTGSRPNTFEVIEFKTSGITQKSLPNLDGYTLVED